MVGTTGLEPVVFRLSVECFSQLSYAPIKPVSGYGDGLPRTVALFQTPDVLRVSGKTDNQPPQPSISYMVMSDNSLFLMVETKRIELFTVSLQNYLAILGTCAPMVQFLFWNERN